MSTSDDPKEPYFFSVVPWIILHRLIKHEEAAFDCLLRQHMAVGDDEGCPAPVGRLLSPGVGLVV